MQDNFLLSLLKGYYFGGERQREFKTRLKKDDESKISMAPDLSGFCQYGILQGE